MAKSRSWLHFLCPFSLFVFWINLGSLFTSGLWAFSCSGTCYLNFFVFTFAMLNPWISSSQSCIISPVAHFAVNQGAKHSPVTHPRMRLFSWPGAGQKPICHHVEKEACLSRQEPYGVRLECLWQPRYQWATSVMTGSSKALAGPMP